MPEEIIKRNLDLKFFYRQFIFRIIILILAQFIHRIYCDNRALFLNIEPQCCCLKKRSGLYPSINFVANEFMSSLTYKSKAAFPVNECARVSKEGFVFILLFTLKNIPLIYLNFLIEIIVRITISTIIAMIKIT